MKTIHKSKYVEILFDETKSLIIDKFLPETDEMTTEDFKKEMHIFVKMCERYRPTKELVHLIDMNYIITPVIQEWLNDEIFSQYANIIKKIAFFMPSQLMTSISIKQTMDEEMGQGFVNDYFDNEQKALDWLLSD